MSRPKRNWVIRGFCNLFGIPYRGLGVRMNKGHASDPEAHVICVDDQYFELLRFLERRFKATRTKSVGGFGIERWHDLIIEGVEFNLNDEEGYGWFLFAKDRTGTETAKKIYEALAGETVD